MMILIWCLIVYAFCNFGNCSPPGLFNLSIYHQLPPLYKFDDYDACHYNNNNNKYKGTYCLVYSEIVPNENSTLWQQILNHSSDVQRQFRHDHLYIGICLQRCEHLMHTYNSSNMTEHYVGRPETTELIAYYADVHKRDVDERVHYDRLIGSCINYEFQQQYDLKLRTSIEYCDQRTPLSNNNLFTDTLEITFYCACLFICVLCLASSLYDYSLKSKAIDVCSKEFYKAELKSTECLLTAFSLCRNYQKLIAPTHVQGEDANNLRCLAAMRVLGVFIVIFAHTLLFYMAAPVSNPEFFEQFFYGYEMDILQNGTAFIQIFFVISGFLLQWQFKQLNSINSKTSALDILGDLVKAVAYRFSRLLPSLVFVLCFSATILTHLQDGPFWRHFTEAERVYCRENWWKNLIFINNNNALKSTCLQQTWYIACDMQLFIFFLLFLMLTAKLPSTKKAVLIALFLLIFIMPATITYLQALQPIFHTSPETYRYLYFKDAASFYQGYTPFYMNFGGYFFGLLSADFYIKTKNTTKYRGSWYELCWWCSFPLGFALLFGAGALMRQNIEAPSIWLSIVAGCYCNLWALLFSAALLGLSCYKLGWWAYEFSRLKLFRPLARLSYQAYLWHIIILRLIVAHTRQPVYVNRFYLLCMFSATFVLTHLLAFFMVLFIEYPFTTLTKNLLKK